MNKKLVSALYALNIVFQAIFDLVIPVGIGALASYLLTAHAGAPPWIWAILITLGTFIGLFSMIKFILTATAALERLERERELTEKEEAEKRRKQEGLKPKSGERDT